MGFSDFLKKLFGGEANQDQPQSTEEPAPQQPSQEPNPEASSESLTGEQEKQQ